MRPSRKDYRSKLWIARRHPCRRVRLCRGCLLSSMRSWSEQLPFRLTSAGDPRRSCRNRLWAALSRLDAALTQLPASNGGVPDAAPAARVLMPGRLSYTEVSSLTDTCLNS